MIKYFVALLFLCLIAPAASISKFTAVFPSTPSSAYQSPAYSLGRLTSGANLTIKIEQAYSRIVLSSSYMLLSITDSTNANTVITFDPSAPMTCTGGSTCTVSWIVTSTASYYLKVTSLSALEMRNLIPIYITASINGLAFLKTADILRQNVVKLFYIAQAGNYTLTLSPESDPSSYYFTLLTMDPTDSLHLRVYSSIDIAATSTANNIGNYTTYYNSGYYGIIVHAGSSSSVSVTFWSDAYMCPYSRSYYDYYSVFAACSFSAVIPNTKNYGLPCLIYDSATQTCRACINGYNLTQGTCISLSSCGSRQYSIFGACSDVSPTCGQFDAFTGACQTCVTAAYYLFLGQCLPINCGNNSYYSVKASACTAVPSACFNFSITYEICYTCNGGYSLSNGVCSQTSNSTNCQLFNIIANACSTCNEGYSLQNGGCTPSTTCASGLVLVNGICIQSQGKCKSNQYFINAMCAELPSNCLALNTFLQCTQCAPNFQIVAGHCKYCNAPDPNFRCVTCPDNQQVDSSGNCRASIQFCATQDSRSSNCLTCKNGFSPVSGICCDAGQVYQSGSCISQGSSSSNDGGSWSSGSSSSKDSGYSSSGSSSSNDGGYSSSGSSSSNDGGYSSSGSSSSKDSGYSSSGSSSSNDGGYSSSGSSSSNDGGYSSSGSSSSKDGGYSSSGSSSSKDSGYSSSGSSSSKDSGYSSSGSSSSKDSGYSSSGSSSSKDGGYSSSGSYSSKDGGYSSSGSSSSKDGGSWSSGSSSSNLRSKYGRYCLQMDPQLQICRACMSGHQFEHGVCK